MTTQRNRSTPRAEETRKRIYDSALQLFRDKGFEQTTMRDIAGLAGVALGAAYYYFSSKEAIVLAYYDELQQGSDQAILQAVAGRKKLHDRLLCVMETRLEDLKPNRAFCDALVRHAFDRKDPLSPFSVETETIRNGAIEQLRVAAEGSDVKIPSDLKPHLPYLLWLYQMSLILFWLYDHSPGQRRTRLLMEKSLGLLVNLVRLSALPLMRPLRKTVLEIVELASAS
jgi:AcrR family transcriptional regulator